MKIELKTNYSVPDREDDVISLPPNVGTLRDLLLYLGERIRFEFVDARQGTLAWDLEIEILLNGKDFIFLSRGLETPLNEGDSLEIYLLPLGGG